MPDTFSFTRNLTPLSSAPVGLGCWAVGGPFWDAGGWMGYGEVDDAESVRAIQTALDGGITFFDTSDVYGCGHAERILAQALGERTHEAVIGAKFGYRFDETARTVTGRIASAAEVRPACEASLKRLNREYIDLYQFHLHDFDIPTAIDIRDELEMLVAEGKIRWYAWCSEDLARVGAFAEGAHCAAAPQIVNVFEANEPLLDFCETNGLVAIARRPLGMGLLTGKFKTDSTIAENDMRRRFKWDFQVGKQAAQLKKLDAVRELLTVGNRTVAQGALGYILAKRSFILPIPGFKTADHVTEHLGAMHHGPLPAATMEELERVLHTFDQ